MGLHEVLVHFAELEDPRSQVNLRHPLVSVVVITLMAVLAGANGPTAIARWAELKGEFLRHEGIRSDSAVRESGRARVGTKRLVFEEGGKFREGP